MARLIGTAGHVDHGKTTLIRALTGIDADRLPEEKKRGMTIDIGFAFIELPAAGRVSIVDVPGHEKFLSNMLVGAAGIDVALLCVAADESVMPQTREHLAILELLPVESLVVALTRSDLADEETREIAKLEVTEMVAETRFGEAPIVEVSAVTGAGLDELKRQLDDRLAVPRQAASGPWYLPVDRVFTVKGHGTIVTGTMAQGRVQTGAEAEIQPGGLKTRIRAIHSHEVELTESERGRRTALNLGGIRAEDVHRGQIVGQPGAAFVTSSFDAKVAIVGELKHAARVRVSVGAAEAIGKAFLNDADPNVVQVRLESPIACAAQQPVIIRKYSPPDLIAGGRIVVPIAKKRRKTEAAQVIEGVADEGGLVQAVLHGVREGLSTEEIARRLGRSLPSLSPVLDGLQKEGAILGFAGLWFGAAEFAESQSAFLAALAALHESAPTQRSHPREAVVKKAGFGWQGKPLDRLLQHWAHSGAIAVEGGSVRLADFRIRLSNKQAEFLQRVAEAMGDSINVPSNEELAAKVHAPIQAVDEIVRLGIEEGSLVRIGDGLTYPAAVLESIRAEMQQRYSGSSFAAAEFRDAFGSSRKYVIPLLEYFDSIGFTVRVGDRRAIREPNG